MFHFQSRLIFSLLKYIFYLVLGELIKLKSINCIYWIKYAVCVIFDAESIYQRKPECHPRRNTRP